MQEDGEGVACVHLAALSQTMQCVLHQFPGQVLLGGLPCSLTVPNSLSRVVSRLGCSLPFACCWVLNPATPVMWLCATSPQAEL